MKWTDLIAGIAYILFGLYISLESILVLLFSAMSTPARTTLGVATILMLSLIFIVAGITLIVRARSTRSNRILDRIVIYGPWGILTALALMAYIFTA